MGELLADTIQRTEQERSPERLALERNRFLRAPVVIGVVSRIREAIPIPEWEQMLSAGACCMTMVIAAHAMGFVANWLTEWCAYHPLVQERLGLKPGERIAGFLYIGHPAAPLEERARPDLDALISRF
jgi:nitroreductase